MEDTDQAIVLEDNNVPIAQEATNEPIAQEDTNQAILETNLDTEIQVVESFPYPNSKSYPRGLVPDVEPRPTKGQKFSSYQEAYVFYKEYARKAGFEVRRSTAIPFKKGEGYSHRYLVCSRQGFKKIKPFDSLKKQKKKSRKRASPRIGCKASVRIRYVSAEEYEIYYVEERHNHSFVHPDDSQFLKSHRRLTYSQKLLVNDMSSINMGPNKAFNVLKQTRGGFDKVGATVVDCKNYKRDLIAFIGESDADMIVDKLKKKQEFLSDFTFEYRIGSDGTLNGLFWADEEAKRNYLAFGDVVGFDATFRTNKYFMIFVPFTGIDNHKRCVTFGAGLLSSESIESYEWLLTAFKKTFSHEPHTLVTDQDPAIKQAIPRVFSTARHRLCLWHISNKFTDKLGSSLSKTGILKQINSIIWNDNISIADFEAEWCSIIDEYSLENHTWLADMYEMRDQWIPAYFTNCHMSGLMKTTSRSEGENYFFGLLSNSDLHLVEFLNNFDTAMEAQRCAQRKNDHDSRYTTPELKCESRIEVDASNIFTRTVFFEIQAEMIASIMKCMSTSVVETEELSTFVIRDMDVDVTQRSDFEVSFNKSDGSLTCSCMRFELYGVLCRHCFYALRMSGIQEFPKRYVSRRWEKDIVERSSFASRLNMSDGQEDLKSMVRDIYFSVDCCVDRLITNLEDMSLYREKQKELKTEIERKSSSLPELTNNEVIAAYYGVTKSQEVTIKVPQGIRNKGSGPHKKRMVGEKEKAIEKSNKTRKCSKCGRPGHNSRSCHKFTG